MTAGLQGKLLQAREGQQRLQTSAGPTVSLLHLYSVVCKSYMLRETLVHLAVCCLITFFGTREIGLVHKID